jgi:predicted component of type VI protein secretion system
MDTIDIALNKFIQYMSDLGLEKWQLLLIAIAIIILLILLARRQRIPKARPKRTFQPVNQPDVIGKNLYNRKESPPEIEDAGPAQPTPAPAKKKTKDERPNLKQTSNQWRKATEQIRLLRREVTKQKRTEEQLRQKIAELTISNQQVGVVTKESKNPEPHIGSFHSTPQPAEVQIQELNQGDQTQKGTRQQIADSICSAGQSERELISHRIRIQKPTGQKNNSLKQKSVPLDIQELKSVAALAKRLRGKNRQKQNN